MALSNQMFLYVIPKGLNQLSVSFYCHHAMRHHLDFLMVLLSGCYIGRFLRAFAEGSTNQLPCLIVLDPKCHIWLDTLCYPEPQLILVLVVIIISIWIISYQMFLRLVTMIHTLG